MSAAGIIQIWKIQTPMTKAKSAAALLGTLSQLRIRLRDLRLVGGIPQLPIDLTYFIAAWVFTKSNPAVIAFTRARFLNKCSSQGI